MRREPARGGGRVPRRFTSLPGPAQVEEVATGRRLLEGARAGDVHVDLSTSAFDAVRALAAREAAVGMQLVDAPVSGGAAAPRRARSR